MAHKKAMTLAEHNAILAADPAYIKMRQEKDAVLKDKERQLREDASPLLEELRERGWDVKSIWDLVNTAESYSNAIPILVDHLKRPYLDRNREAIARALAVPAAAYTWPILKEEYRLAPAGSGVKNGLAVALAAIAGESVVDELIMLIRNPNNGESRLFLLRGLRRISSRAARESLVEMASDPVLAKEMASWTCA